MGAKRYSLRRCRGQGGERKAVRGRCHLLSVLMDASCQEQESRLLAARGLLQEPLKRRKTYPTGCKKRVNQPPARNCTFCLLEWGKQGRDSRIKARDQTLGTDGRRSWVSSGWMGSHDFPVDRQRGLDGAGTASCRIHRAADGTPFLTAAAGSQPRKRCRTALLSIPRSGSSHPI